ncbi:MAG: Gfo/Idh/MocA family protein [Faecousia sp.]
MINLGVIGYGVRVDMLMDNLFSLEKEVCVKAVADLNPRRVRDLMTRGGSDAERYALELDKMDANLRQCRMDPDQITFYHDADEMLDHEKLDGVILGTNCNTHAVLAKKVLDRNLPLFLEKPVGVCQEDLDLLKECDRKPHAPVVVSFPLRVTNLVQEVKRIINIGTIGKIDHVQAYNDVGYGFVYYHDWYRDERISHGLFLQKATHDVDVINYLTGEMPVAVCAMKSKQIFKGDMPAGLRCSRCEKQYDCMESSYNITRVRNDIPRSDWCCYAKDTGNEDSGTLIVRYASGMHAMYSQNFFARKGAARRGARLYGYKGTVEFDFLTQMITVYDHMSDKVTRISVPIPEKGHGGGDTALMKNFVELCEGGTKTSVAPLSEGIKSAQVCLAAKHSSEQDVFEKIIL